MPPIPAGSIPWSARSAYSLAKLAVSGGIPPGTPSAVPDLSGQSALGGYHALLLQPDLVSPGLEHRVADQGGRTALGERGVGARGLGAVVEEGTFVAREDDNLGVRQCLLDLSRGPDSGHHG